MVTMVSASDVSAKRGEVARLCDHTYLPDLLDSNSIVVDLGANRGEFAHELIRRCGCSVYAAEPLSGLHAEIGASPRLKLFRVALGKQNGSAPLRVYGGRCASLLGARENDETVNQEEVEVVDLHTFLVRAGLGRVDLMKVDVEGAELDIFESVLESDLRLIGQITIEFHDFIYPNLKPRAEAVKRRLCKLGFWMINFSLDNTDVLFINRDAGSVSTLRYGKLRYVTKYLEGAKRRLRRWQEEPNGGAQVAN
jgi:FkbM family methyltransferase